jgi:hypothetical protein
MLAGVAGTVGASAPTAGRTYPSGGHRQNIRPIDLQVWVRIRRDPWLASAHLIAAPGGSKLSNIGLTFRRGTPDTAR